MTISLEGRLRTRLGEAIGLSRLIEADARGPSPEMDLARYQLGRCLAWVRPRSTAEVVRVIEVARELGVPVVAVGKRTAYWRPLSLEGAIALDTSALDTVGEPDLCGGFVRCGAGATVRQVSRAARAAGAMLPAFPDATGDTSIGSMVAAGFASGIGTGMTTAAGLVAGLSVVLGSGEVLATGTAAVLAASPFSRLGLPDPTELFFGSDGALGVITEVSVRIRPAIAMAQLAFLLPPGTDGLCAALSLAERLRSPGVYDTFRTAAVLDPRRGAWAPTEVDLVVLAPLGAEELGQRTVRVREIIGLLVPVAEVHESRELPGSHQRIPLRADGDGRPDDHWQSLVGEHFVGVDVVVSYGDAMECLEVAAAIVTEAGGMESLERARTAFYFAPDYVNVGLHFVFSDRAAAAPAHELVQSAIARLGKLAIIPYRWGRLWGHSLGNRLDPTYQSLMADLKRRFDPDGILHPGATIFGAG